MLTLNTTHYDAPKAHLVESLGLLPHWVVEYNMLGESDIVQYMTKRYGFGELYNFRGTVTKDGPVYFYPYAITALPTKDGYFITRMD